jgi:hypothetical protein
MSLSGPRLDEMKRQLVDWWLATRRRLIDRLEEGYPYGSIELTPQEQIENFVSMKPDDWTRLVARLMERFKGEPNQGELVRQELRKYQEKMYSLMGRAR